MVSKGGNLEKRIDSYTFLEFAIPDKYYKYVADRQRRRKEDAKKSNDENWKTKARYIKT